MNQWQKLLLMVWPLVMTLGRVAVIGCVRMWWYSTGLDKSISLLIFFLIKIQISVPIGRLHFHKNYLVMKTLLYIIINSFTAILCLYFPPLYKNAWKCLKNIMIDFPGLNILPNGLSKIYYVWNISLIGPQRRLLDLQIQPKLTLNFIKKFCFVYKASLCENIKHFTNY